MLLEESHICWRLQADYCDHMYVEDVRWTRLLLRRIVQWWKKLIRIASLETVSFNFKVKLMYSFIWFVAWFYTYWIECKISFFKIYNVYILNFERKNRSEVICQKFDEQRKNSRWVNYIVWLMLLNLAVYLNLSYSKYHFITKYLFDIICS